MIIGRNKTSDSEDRFMNQSDNDLNVIARHQTTFDPLKWQLLNVRN